jgi:hypothetical protein
MSGKRSAEKKGETNMSGYSINITYDADTQKALNNTYTLYGCKAVKSPLPGGQPLAWFIDSTFLGEGLSVTWNESYQGFISKSKLISGGVITTDASIDADPGDKVYVDDSGNLTAGNGGDPHGITIVNKSSTPYTCGISELQGTTMVPMCAFALHGMSGDDIVPIEKVLLYFQTQPVDTGTVLEQTGTQGVLVDLTENPNVAVTYDIDKGWSTLPPGASWAQLIDPASPLVPLLITSE